MNTFWVKSSLSFSNGNCIEVTELPGDAVGVRNSRDPDGPVLKFTRGEWDAFLGGARRGEFDRFGSAAGRPGADGVLTPEGRHTSERPGRDRGHLHLGSTQSAALLHNVTLGFAAWPAARTVSGVRSDRQPGCRAAKAR